nr:hypothetical protein CFP56_52860 [Quercus suber]
MSLLEQTILSPITQLLDMFRHRGRAWSPEDRAMSTLQRKVDRSTLVDVVHLRRPPSLTSQAPSESITTTAIVQRSPGSYVLLPAKHRSLVFLAPRPLTSPGYACLLRRSTNHDATIYAIGLFHRTSLRVKQDSARNLTRP